jgi:hypothetical protein
MLDVWSFIDDTRGGLDANFLFLITGVSSGYWLHVRGCMHSSSVYVAWHPHAHKTDIHVFDNIDTSRGRQALPSLWDMPNNK